MESHLAYMLKSGLINGLDSEGMLESYGTVTIYKDNIEKFAAEASQKRQNERRTNLGDTLDLIRKISTMVVISRSRSALNEAFSEDNWMKRTQRWVLQGAGNLMVKSTGFIAGIVDLSSLNTGVLKRSQKDMYFGGLMGLDYIYDGVERQAVFAFTPWTTEENCDTAAIVDDIRDFAARTIIKMERVGYLAYCGKFDNGGKWRADVRIMKVNFIEWGQNIWDMPCTDWK